jgi:hypothetical protein
LRRLVSTALLLLLLLAALPVQHTALAQGSPTIAVRSLYTLNRYGFATINESVRVSNAGSSAVVVPSLTFGFGNLTSEVVRFNFTGSQFTVSPQLSGSSFTGFTVNGPTLQPKGNATFMLSALLDGVVSHAKNGTTEVLTMSAPSISQKVDSLVNVVQMPVSTAFRSAPVGLKANLVGSNNTYSSTQTEVTPSAAVTSVRAVSQSSVQDFNPIRVFYAQRTLTLSQDGSPIVTDKVEFQNMGSTPLSQLYVNILAPASTKVTVVTSTEPRLINPVTITLSSGAIDLTEFAAGYPVNGVPAGANFTLTYQYPLGSNHYTASGGKVTLDVPDTPPVKAFIDSYSVMLSLPQGATSSQSAPSSLGSVTPWQGGQTTFSYGLSVGWVVDTPVPAASLVFILLVVLLFSSRTTTATEEKEEEEETSSEMASTMINVFDEKTTLINSLWPEIEGKDPNELDKEYFDELRSRLDTFRSRALQRLNEVRQKSTSKRFFEVVNQIQATEREVDRAAKDKLNLYQQYYMRQMRKEVYDRLLPQYTKRLEKALNQLSDELHTVQREAKLL